MLLVVKKGIRGGICHSINKYETVNDKYMKNYDKDKESSYLKYWYVNNLYGRAISQKDASEWFWVSWRYFWIWLKPYKKL